MMSYEVPLVEQLGFSSFGSYLATLVALVLVHHVVVYAIARFRGQPGVAIMALRDVVIGTMWLVTILGSWIAIYFYLRALYRALPYVDVAAGLAISRWPFQIAARHDAEILKPISFWPAPDGSSGQLVGW